MRMARRTKDDQGAAWLSFPNLFSDGDRVPSREATFNETGAASLSDGDAESHHSGVSEVSALRLEIGDIQEAIKNHDLWVQDAVVMRTDVDDLQAALRDHEKWMSHLSSALRQIQERENRLEAELSSLRLQPASPAFTGAQSPKTMASPGLKRVPSNGSMKRAGSGSDMHKGDTPSLPGMDKPGSPELPPRDDVDQLVQRIELGLSQQMGRALRMLRTMVTAVEGGLARQLDGERTARRSALAELRHEIAVMKRPLAPKADCGTSGRKVVDEDYVEGAIGGLRYAVEKLDQRASDAAAEAQKAITELHSELASVKAELQLQAVAAGALALTSGQLSQKARMRSMQALEDRAVVVKKGTTGGTGISEVVAHHPGGAELPLGTGELRRGPLHGGTGGTPTLDEAPRS